MRKYIMSLFAILVSICLFFPLDTEAAVNKDKIEQGIYIGEVGVSNMNQNEASAAINDYISKLEESVITLNAMNGNKVTVSPKDLGLSWKNNKVLEEAVALGKEGNIVERYKVLKDLEHENVILPLELSVDKTAIASIITEECLEFNVSAVDAALTRENGAFKIEPGQTGVIIDEAASQEAVYQYMTEEWEGENSSIDLVAEVEEPRGTEEELSKVKDVLGTFTTSYSTSNKNRSGNVENACRLINGTLLYPGDSFSTLDAISPFTQANGYYMAGSYLNGLVVDSLGGGICQVSTTLYNTVLKSELEIKERHNHSMSVSYVDLSADAAISEGSRKDFIFTNTYDFPIYIEGHTSNKQVTFTIYGMETRASNREVTYESKITKTIPAVGEKVVADGSQPIGYIKVQSPHTGYVAQLWKVVTENGKETSRTQINSSSYKMVPRTASVGVSSADPNMVAAVNAAIATQSIDQVRAVVGGAGAVSPEQAAQDAAIAAQQAAIAAQQAAIAEQQQQQQQPPQDAPVQ